MSNNFPCLWCPFEFPHIVHHDYLCMYTYTHYIPSGSQIWQWTIPHLQIYIYIWGVPEIGVPPNHPIVIGCSLINHPAIGVSPIYGNPHMLSIYVHLKCAFSSWIFQLAKFDDTGGFHSYGSYCPLIDDLWWCTYLKDSKICSKGDFPRLSSLTGR